MQQDDRQVVIREIEYWRKNKLLPEHYCQYLLNLYTEGETSSRSRFSLSSNMKVMLYALLSAFGLIVISYIIFHFTRFSIGMQIFILAAAIGFGYALAYWFRFRNPAVTNISLGASSLLLLQGGIYLLHRMDFSNRHVLYYLLLCCVIWWVTSLIAGRLFLLVCALVGVGLAYGFLLYPYWDAHPSLWMGQILWLPPVILFLLLSRLRNERLASASLIYAFFAVLFAFAPEIEALYIQQVGTDMVQLVLLVKAIIASFVLFLWFRKGNTARGNDKNERI